MRRQPHRDVVIYTAPGCSRGVLVLVGDEIHGAVLALSPCEADDLAQAIIAAARELVRSEPTTTTEVRQ